MIKVPKIVALSDDLTGALGLSMLIANESIPVLTLTAWDKEKWALAGRTEAGDENFVGDSRSQAEALVINTDTRSLDSDTARDRIAEVMNHLSPETRVVKRFDTTLRGHLGVELDEILRHRPKAAAIVVPSFPAGGRHCLGGYQLINGVPIEQTEAGADPCWPIRSSYVPDYFRVMDSERADRVHHFPLQALSSSDEELRVDLKKILQPGAVLVVDAYSDADINRISKALIGVDGEHILTSPGVFISEVLGLLCRKTTRHPALVVIGSATELTRKQVSVLEEKYKVSYLEIPADVIVQGTVSRATEEFLSVWNRADAEVLVVRPEWRMGRPGLESTILRAVTDAAQMVLSALNNQVSGLILSGGETAGELISRLGASLIRPEKDFASLVMGGVMLDGQLDGVKVVTKGGLVGDRAIMLRAMNWLLTEQ